MENLRNLSLLALMCLLAAGVSAVLWISSDEEPVIAKACADFETEYGRINGIKISSDSIEVTAAMPPEFVYRVTVFPFKDEVGWPDRGRAYHVNAISSTRKALASDTRVYVNVLTEPGFETIGGEIVRPSVYWDMFSQDPNTRYCKTAVDRLAFYVAEL